MKRVGFIAGLGMAVLLAPFGIGLSGAGLTAQVNVAQAACSPDIQRPGCPPIKTPKPGSTPTPTASASPSPSTSPGAVTSDGSGDLLASAGGPVCVAVPIFSGSQGSCGPGETEISNDPGSGGAIVFYLKLVLKLVNAAVGGVIILVLVISGIQYITSMADPGRVKSAKGRIEHAMIALVLYMFTFAILNFLVPGGIL